MRFKKPHVADLSDVIIKREGDVALIEYKDPTISSVNFRIGSEINSMTDRQVLELFNDSIRARNEFAARYVHVAVEIPPGQPQIRYFEEGYQWVPRGDVLRCEISDSEGGQAIIYIDDHELSIKEFGRLLIAYAGWGMRICFVPDDRLDEQPTIEVQDASDDCRY